MSDIIEKTWNSIPSLLGTALSGNKNRGGGTSNTRAFKNFMENCHTLSSKTEQASFLQKEVELERNRLKQPNLSPNDIRECLIRLMFCHMMDYDVEFAFISAVKLAQQGAMLHKKSGYLFCAVFLSHDHELVMLLVNTIQKDLTSSNMLHVSMALTAAAHLIGPDMIPALMPAVLRRLTHDRETVRRKAVICVHAFIEKCSDVTNEVLPHIQKALQDRDPGVMWAALRVYHTLIQESPAAYTHLVPVLLPILTQIMSRKLNQSYDHRGTPAPWLQILILKMIGELATPTTSTQESESMQSVLLQVLRQTDANTITGLSVIHECIVTIVKLRPPQTSSLMKHAAVCIGKFLRADSTAYKYIGLSPLTELVKTNGQFVMEFQDVVMECLDGKSEMLKRKTLDLLHVMCNAQNYPVITSRLMSYLRSCTQPHTQRTTQQKIVDIVHKFDDNCIWRVSTLNALIQLNIKDMDLNLPHILIDMLKKDVSEDSVIHQTLRHTYWLVIQEHDVCEDLLVVACWILGELIHSGSTDPGCDDVVSHLTTILLRTQTHTRIQQCIVTALLKLSQHCDLPAEKLSDMNTFVSPSNILLKQSVRELIQYNKTISKDKRQISISDDQMDFTLSFMDSYVSDAVESGASVYKSRTKAHQRPAAANRSAEDSRLFTGLNFSPYSDTHQPIPATASTNANESMQSLNLSGITKVWSKDGLVTTAMDDVSMSGSSDPMTATAGAGGGDDDGGGGAEVKLQEAQKLPTGTSPDSNASEKQQLEASQLFAGISNSINSSAQHVAGNSTQTTNRGVAVSSSAGTTSSAEETINLKQKTLNTASDRDDATSYIYKKNDEIVGSGIPNPSSMYETVSSSHKISGSAYGTSDQERSNAQAHGMYSMQQTGNTHATSTYGAAGIMYSNTGPTMYGSRFHAYANMSSHPDAYASLGSHPDAYAETQYCQPGDSSATASGGDWTTSMAQQVEDKLTLNPSVRPVNDWHKMAAVVDSDTAQHHHPSHTGNNPLVQGGVPASLVDRLREEHRTMSVDDDTSSVFSDDSLSTSPNKAVPLKQLTTQQQYDDISMQPGAMVLTDNASSTRDSDCDNRMLTGASTYTEFNDNSNVSIQQPYTNSNEPTPQYTSNNTDSHK